MKKVNYVKLIGLIFLFLFFSKNSFSQVNAPESANHKTVVYKIRVEKSRTLDQAVCTSIDNTFLGKKGITKAKTNLVSRETIVQMNSNVPENDLKAIFIANKLEVEKITVTDNTK